MFGPKGNAQAREASDPRTRTGLDPYVREKFLELWLAAQHPDDDF